MIDVILSLMILSGGAAESQSWKNIVPLRSTRAEVERLLGRPYEPCTHMCRYDGKEQVLLVRYSGAPCTDDEENRWRVPPDTVISLTVNLERWPKLSSLKLNRKRFYKTKDPELHGYTSYTDDAAGLTYAVTDKGRVFSIRRFPAAKDDTTFSCSSAPARAAPLLSPPCICPYAATQPARKY